MGFHYSPSTSNYEVSCGVGLTTVATWVKDNVTHQCQFTTVIGGGVNYDGYVGGTGKSHTCTVSGDCYSDDCNSDDDTGEKVWMVHPKS